MRAAGTEFPVELAITRIQGHEPPLLTGFLRDITERKRAEGEIRSLNVDLEQRVSDRVAEIRQLAYYDPLTGLPNRTLFADSLALALDAARRNSRRLAVLYIGLDGFKLVNESLGHSAGDELLSTVGSLLRRHLEPGDLLARLGGDEFIVLSDEVDGAEAATDIAERLLGLFRQPFTIGGVPRFITASVGVAVGNPAAEAISPEGLLQAADVALHQAKTAGKARAIVFEPDMTALARARLELLTDLQQALERDELVLYYQPLVEVGAGAITGVEALVRWQHPRRGLLLPDEFIHLAEEMGLILPLGRWVLDAACRQARAWRSLRPKGPALPVSINLSVKELVQPGLAEHVAGVLRAADLEPGCIKIEVTESAVMQDVEFSIATLHELREIGVRLAIDDFGTGYSSLSYLRRLPVDTLKIDQSLLSDVEYDPGAQAIVEAIVRLAHALGMDVTAEGVETPAQASWLTGAECDRGQGFFYHRPMPADAMTALLRTNGPGIRARAGG